MSQEQKNGQPDEKKPPRRYKLYDHLNVSLRTVNGIIYVLVALILTAVVIGMMIR